MKTYSLILKKMFTLPQYFQIVSFSKFYMNLQQRKKKKRKKKKKKKNPLKKHALSILSIFMLQRVYEMQCSTTALLLNTVAKSRKEGYIAKCTAQNAKMTFELKISTTGFYPKSENIGQMCICIL